MDCWIPKGLDRILHSKGSKYFEAHSAACRKVSAELASPENVDVERADRQASLSLLVTLRQLSGSSSPRKLREIQ